LPVFGPLKSFIPETLHCIYNFLPKKFTTLMCIFARAACQNSKLHFSYIHRTAYQDMRTNSLRNKSTMIVQKLLTDGREIMTTASKRGNHLTVHLIGSDMSRDHIFWNFGNNYIIGQDSRIRLHSEPWVAHITRDSNSLSSMKFLNIMCHRIYLGCSGVNCCIYLIPFTKFKINK
jgi:hypothetical protein